jgi:VWFA-related protein
MTRFACCLWSLFLLAGSGFIPCAAQSAASVAPTAQQSAPAGVTTLHTGTKLVVVDIVVRDKSGQPVHGLTRSDFLLSESGEPQTLKSFEEYAKPGTPVALPQMPTLPPGLFTNFTPVAGKGPLNVLLIDGLNTPLSDQPYLRQQLVEYAKHIPPGTRIAIFGLADHLYMLQGFTSDEHQLQMSLGGIKSGPTSALQPNDSTSNAALSEALNETSPSFAGSSSGSALMSDDLQSFIEKIGVSQKSMQIHETIAAFDSLGRWLVNFPGRKNLVWFSGAFPLGVDPSVSFPDNTDIPSEDDDEFRAMTNLLTRAQVSVYPIDPRGLTTESAIGTEAQASFAQRSAEHATMQSVASDTGGEALYNRNDLTKAVGDAIADGANYYTLSYSPSEKKTGGEWRNIHIALANPAARKGVELSYRRGYFADNLKVPGHHTGTASVNEDPNAPSVESVRFARTAMLHGAPTPQDIPFTTRILPASAATEDTPAPGNELDPKNPMKPPYRRYDVDCAAAARYFELTETADGHHVGAIQAAVFVYSNRGMLLNTVTRTLHLDLTPAEYAKFQRLGFREHFELSVPAKGESFFRVGIDERGSGRIGAVEVASSAVRNLPPPDYAQAGSPSTSQGSSPQK